MKVVESPPLNAAPAQLEVLLAGRPQLHSISTTIVDLAIRGHLLIEESELDDDYMLHRRKSDDDLRAYERQLLARLFATRDSVNLRGLDFKLDYYDTHKALNADAGLREWFRWRPDAFLNLQRALGCCLAILGLLIVYFQASAHTGNAKYFVPIIIVGLLLGFLAPVRPPKTPAGHAATSLAQAFGEHLASAEVRPNRFTARPQDFYSHLAYALSLGIAAKWSIVYQDRRVPAAAWYRYAEPLAPVELTNRLDIFVVRSTMLLLGRIPLRQAMKSNLTSEYRLWIFSGVIRILLGGNWNRFPLPPDDGRNR